VSTDAQWLDSMPEVYDRTLGPVLFAPFAAEVAARAAALSPSRVLELAAGTGIGTADLIRAVPDAAVTATDLNAAMVAWAAARHPGAAWSVADAQQLDFDDASFDLVVCQFGVMFFPDKAAAFAEAARVLSPAGRLLFTVWDTVEGSTLSAALVDSLAAVLPDDPPSFLTRVPHGYADTDQIRADLLAGGLLADSVDRMVLRGRAVTAKEFTHGFCRGTPLRFALEERGALESLTEALADDMTTRLGAEPIEGELTAFVVTARRAGPTA
jgi:SAM-dependent methyltransferase